MDHPSCRQKRAAGLGRHRLPWAVVFAIALVLASVTDKLATFATNVVGDLGLPGVFLLMVPESALHPDPVGGDDAVRRLQRPPGRVPAVGGSGGRFGGQPGRLVDRLRDRLLRPSRGAREARDVPHITPAHLAWADRWFERYGAPAVFFSRMLPIVRTFISLPAGVARMPFWKFSVLTFAGCLPWVFALTFAGQKAAENWTSWKDSLHYVDYTVAVLIVLGVVYLAVRWRRNRNRGAPRMRRPERRARAAPRGGARGAPRADRAAADLLLGTHHAGPVAARLALRRPRSGAAQGLRGGAARRDGGGAARRPARRGGGRRARPGPPPRHADPGLVRAACHRRLHARAPDRAAAGHAAHDRRRACCSAPRPWRPPTASGRRAAAATRPASSTRSRSASPRPAR